MSELHDAHDRLGLPSTITDAHDRAERPEDRESRATDSWARLAHSLVGKLPRALERAEASRQRIARLR